MVTQLKTHISSSVNRENTFKCINVTNDEVRLVILCKNGNCQNTIHK